MWTVLAIICTLDAPECIQLADQRGPYETEAECIARGEELRPLIVSASKVVSYRAGGPVRYWIGCKADAAV